MSDQITKPQASAAKVQPRIHSAPKKPLQEMVPLRTPISAHIDISSVCNYKCSFCFQADIKGMKAVGLKRGFMDWSMFTRIVDELSQFPDKVKKIKIGNHGEPSLHPKFVDMVRYAVASNAAEVVEVFTNGSKLTPEINQGLAESGLRRINISLEGLSDERYWEVAGVRQNFQEIIDGVADLYERKSRINSPLTVYVKIADQAHPLKGEETNPYALTEDEKKFFFDTFGPNCDEIFVEKIVPQWSETQLDKQNDVSDTGMYGQEISSWKHVCPFVFMYLHFNCDGTVSPCTLDWPRKVVIGNTNDQSVSDVWNGQSLKDLQLAMLHKKRDCINFCGSCSAPMVCVEDDLDPYLATTLENLNSDGVAADLKNNAWVQTSDG